MIREGDLSKIRKPKRKSVNEIKKLFMNKCVNIFLFFFDFKSNNFCKSRQTQYISLLIVLIPEYQ